MRRVPPNVSLLHMRCHVATVATACIALAIGAWSARPFAFAAAAISERSHDAAAPRCTRTFAYPSSIGRQTFMLATATAATVAAPADTQYAQYAPTAKAQIMKVADVAGFQSDAIRRGLRASDGTAVFVRYVTSSGCGPFPAYDGALDSVGLNGLYVGRPRPTKWWIDGRPTFEIFPAPDFPLPQRAVRYVPAGDTTPTMTAHEMFTMYRAFWAESVSVDDPWVERRIRQWIKNNPETTRKRPAAGVAVGMARAVLDARLAATPSPFGGTFVIHVSVPGVDSLVMYGQTSTRPRDWIGDARRDSSTGLVLALGARSYAIDITTASSLEAFQQSPWRINHCSPIPIVVDPLPIVARTDSAWTGQVYLSAFLDCAPRGSTLQSLTLPGATRSLFSDETTVTFRLHADGRLTFEARGIRDGDLGILARGERVSNVR